MPYGRCGRCYTNFARAALTFCPFIIIGHTNFDLLVNHIMFWPHQLWKPSSAHDGMALADMLWNVDVELLLAWIRACVSFLALQFQDSSKTSIKCLCEISRSFASWTTFPFVHVSTFSSSFFLCFLMILINTVLRVCRVPMHYSCTHYFLCLVLPVYESHLGVLLSEAESVVYCSL